ncbi:MAG: Beta-lactamase-like Metallo-hydrolase [Frankiales bacterium]|nr:Beta-lactamase-like Metallo-hydrolase [Frankiales bacterium]
MTITGTRQREAWLARRMPPVEELRPGLWSVPVPIPDNPLRYVSVYVLALADGGLGLVDAGWDSDEGWQALTAGLAGIGASTSDVRGVLVTHLHPDHLGLAARVRAASGAWLAMHPADAAVVGRWNSEGTEATRARQVDALVRLGAARSDAESDVASLEQLSLLTRLALPDRLLEDGDLADLSGWQLRAVHTPGHTAGHLCFSEERTGLFFSGDHVLPRITPHISSDPDVDPDPLRSYLSSLAAVRGRPATEVLPAHEWRFTGLAERVDQLTEHHEQRLLELVDALQAHPGSTAWDLAAHVSWSRPWEAYERHMRIVAVSETDAHLRLLESRGLVSGADTGAVAWTAVGR